MMYARLIYITFPSKVEQLRRYFDTPLLILPYFLIYTLKTSLSISFLCVFVVVITVVVSLCVSECVCGRL